MRSRTLTTLALLMGTAGLAAAAPVIPAVGGTAPAFTLPSNDGVARSLGDLAGRKNLVVVFFRGVW